MKRRPGALLSALVSFLGLLQIAAVVPALPAFAADPASLRAARAPDVFRVAQVDTTPVGQPPSETGPEGSRRSIPELWTRTGRTFVLADGTYEAFLSPEPVNYRGADGAWTPIDNRLVAAAQPGYSHRNAANEYSVELPPRLDGNPVRVTRGRYQLSFALQGARGGIGVGGDTATYRNAFRGVDVAYSAEATKVKETITLHGPEAPQTFAFDVTASEGLSAALEGGEVVFSDEAGNRAFTIPAPFMFDSSGEPDGYSRDITTALERSADGWTLKVTPDAGWLAAPERQWPVTIDPVVEMWPTRDCHVSSGARADLSFCAEDKLLVGNDGSSVHRALVHFDVAGNLPRKVSVLKAAVALTPDEALGAAAGADVRMHVVDQAWSTAATWNRRDGVNAWTTAGGTYSSTVRRPAGSSFRWDAIDVVQEWADGARANHGFLFKEADETIVRRSAFESSNQSLRYPTSLYVVYTPRVGVKDYYKFEEFPLSDRIQVKVNVASGNLLLQQRDVLISGTGLDAKFDRTYNSLAPVSADLANGDGNGQKWEYDPGSNIRLYEVQGNNSGDLTFESETGVAETFRKSNDGTFRAPPGLNAHLETNGLGYYDVVFNHSGVRYVFNSSGLVRIQDRNSNKIVLGYDTANTRNVSSITDTQGRVTTVVSEASGKYKGLITSVRDPAGRTHSYSYDGSGNLVGYTNPANQLTQYAYDNASNLVKVTTPGGSVTELTYDTTSRVTSVKRVTNPATGAGSTTTFTYGAGTTAVRDANGNTTTNHHDGRDRVTKVVDALGNTTSHGYTTNNNVESYTDAMQSKTMFSYSTDGRNNLMSAALPTGASSSLAYDDALHPYSASSKTDDRGNVTNLAYDAAGNLQSATDKTTGDQTAYVYNANGTVASAKDPKGNLTTFSYDLKGNLTGIQFPGPVGSVSLTYDAISRLTSVTDGKGQKKTFAYDALDRMTSATFAGPVTITYGYDGNGNLTSRVDNTGTTTLAYDSVNRLTRKTLPSGGTIDYGYDAVGNLTSITDAGGATLYGYDAVNVQTSLTEPGGAKTTFGHDNNYRRTSTAYPNGVTMSSTWDGSGRLTKIVGKNPAGAVLTSFAYSYTDPVTGKDTARRHSVTDAAGNTTAYTYDTLGRLKTATTKDTAGTVTDSRSYTYDRNGNRLSQTVNGATTSYAYNAANQLTQAGTTTFTYDANGNLTGSSAGMTLTYNSKDQTTSIKPAGGTALNMAYADAGQVERVSAGGTTFVHSVLGVTMETTGTARTHYVKDETGTLVGQRGPAGSHYYLFDGLGSVVALTNSSGAVVNTYRYGPWGEDLGGQRQVANPWRYTGGYFDSSTGLYKFGTRYYDPAVGRFTQPDPARTTVNPYAYALGDPINHADPTGLVDVSAIADALSFAADVAGLVSSVSVWGVAFDLASTSFDIISAIFDDNPCTTEQIVFEVISGMFEAAIFGSLAEAGFESVSSATDFLAGVALDYLDVSC